jgi:hypothetical protein
MQTPPFSRRVQGSLIIGGIALLQVATEFLGSHDLLRLISKTLALVIGVPVLVLCSTRFFHYAARNAVGWVAPVFVAGVAWGLFFAGLLRATRALTVALGVPASGNESYASGDALRVGFMMGLTYFALWAAASLLPAFAEDARLHTLEAEKLRAESELAHLRMHLSPHFLLNTLNAIAGLVTEDPLRGGV